VSQGVSTNRKLLAAAAGLGLGLFGRELIARRRLGRPAGERLQQFEGAGHEPGGRPAVGKTV